MPDQDVHTEHDPREPVVGHAHVDEEAVADPDAEPLAGDELADGSATTYESAAHNGHDAPDEDAADSSFGRATTFGADDEPVETGVIDEPVETTDHTDRSTFGHPAEVDDEADAGDAAEHDRAADEALAGENGFGDRPADDEAFRGRTTDETTFDAETHGETLHDPHEVADDSTVVDSSIVDTEPGDAESFADGSAVDDHVEDHVTEDAADTDASGLTYTGDVADLDTDTSADAIPETAALPVQEDIETPADQALKPGAATTTPLGKLWADADVDGMRARWRELQLKFIDDPQEVAGEAESLVTEAVDALNAALTARKDALSDWRGSGTGSDDTERLRAAVRQYRDFFDSLLEL